MSQTKTKHTPGPWKVDGPFDVKGGGRTLEIGAETGGGHITVAGVGFNEPDAEGQEACRADARLIAAAPDLLYAAQRMATIPARDCPWGCESDHDDNCPVTMAFRATEKARGAA